MARKLFFIQAGILNTVIQQKLYCVSTHSKNCSEECAGSSKFQICIRGKKKSDLTFLFSLCYISVIIEHLITQCPGEKTTG